KPYGWVGGRGLWAPHQLSPSILVDSKPYGWVGERELWAPHQLEDV
ncbi:hypothetical protein AVEN_41524-1, partial [Araneus ventricosus]